jgi:flavin reductase (DIM6/NTAB) family NADH-FMN oxidoreductase RutF
VRRLASGVAVLTVGRGHQVHGATVSAVTAVSRDPLLVAVCLRHGSAFLDLAQARRRFAVNILSSRQALLASWFADPGRPPGAAQFDCVAWEPDEFSGAPLIVGSLASLGCQVAASVAAGDHEVLLAEVRSGASGADGAPLLSFAGQLHSVAQLHSAAQPSAAQLSAAQLSAAQLSAAQLSAAQLSVAPHDVPAEGAVPTDGPPLEVTSRGRKR